MNASPSVRRPTSASRRPRCLRRSGGNGSVHLWPPLLKHIDLLLDEDLITRLEEESRLRQASVSDVVRNLLARDLGMIRPTRGFVERIRRLHATIGPIPLTAPRSSANPEIADGEAVLDTSVVVKWFFVEEGPDRVEIFLRELEAEAARVIVLLPLFYDQMGTVSPRCVLPYGTSTPSLFLSASAA